MKLLLLLVASIFFISCRYTVDTDQTQGSGNVITQERTISKDFTKVEANQGINVIIQQSDKKSVVVEADDNIIDRITTKVVNGVLIIESENGFNTQNTPEVVIKMPIISGLASNTGASITGNNNLITENIEINASGASEINIEVEADNIVIESNSGSEVKVIGKALKLKTVATSGSEIIADGLITNEIYSEASSGSSIIVMPVLKLQARASSGSSVQYKKTPKILSKEESSGGSVSL